MLTYRDVLDDGGLIARRRENYERREAQLAMAAEVDAAIRAKHCLSIEAGTGVGKSFAYLVPAILYVTEDQARRLALVDGKIVSVEDVPSEPPAPDDPPANNGSASEQKKSDRYDEWRYSNAEEVFAIPSDALEQKSANSFFPEGVIDDSVRRVVVSTHTIGLQEQLFEKDIPFLNSIMPVEFTAALAKGRANYICLRRFANAKKSLETEKLIDGAARREYERLTQWVNTTVDGSKADLDPPPDQEIWEDVCCEQGNCLGRKCKYRDACFYIRARKVLAGANIIVVNHALLFSDLAVRREGGSILPAYDVLIFDEAHTMEDVASDHLGVELSQYAVDYRLGKIYNDRTQKGLLTQEMDEFKIGTKREVFMNAGQAVDECRLRAQYFFEDLDDWLEKHPGSSNGRVFEKNIVSKGLSEALAALAVKLRICADYIDDPGRKQEYVSARERVEAINDSVLDWLEQRSEGYVYWIERMRGRKAYIKIVSAPIDVSPILREHLFNKIPTVVAASATLTASTGSKSVGLRARTAPMQTFSNIPEAIAAPADKESPETRRAFAFFRNRVGLNGAPARALGSPFNYREQMTLVITKGLEIGEAAANRLGISEEERKARNERRLFAALREYIAETDGGAFVLFTNNAQMKNATQNLAPWLAVNNYPFYSQAEGTSRSLMVARFKESNRSVLFGVDSFWQGVDVPGQALRNVIIVKFPFQSPDKPLVEARMERIRAAGGRPFYELTLPNAILKFKQGVGRLIRTRDDVGQVVLLDERIHLKSYGSDFLRALPDCKLRVDTFYES